MLPLEETQTATAGQTEFVLQRLTYLSHTSPIYKDKVLQVLGTDYNFATGSNIRIIFADPMVGGEKIRFVERDHFYHQTIRRISAVFGSLFNEMRVVIRDENGDPLKKIKVPLSYGHWQKYIARTRQESSLDSDLDGGYPTGEGFTEVRMTLPRMSFELTQIGYDPERKLNDFNRRTACPPTGPNGQWQFQNVPYNFEFSLYIMVKKFDEGLQIVEQIVPYFTPSLAVPVKVVPELDITEDIIFTLESVTPETNYEGGFDETEYVMWTLTFVVKGNLYKPTNISKLINEAILNINEVAMSILPP